MHQCRNRIEDISRWLLETRRWRLRLVESVWRVLFCPAAFLVRQRMSWTWTWTWILSLFTSRDIFLLSMMLCAQEVESFWRYYSCSCSPSPTRGNIIVSFCACHNQSFQFQTSKRQVSRHKIREQQQPTQRPTMIRQITFFLALAASSLAIELTPENFASVTDGKTVFLKFFAPW